MVYPSRLKYEEENNGQTVADRAKGGCHLGAQGGKYPAKKWCYMRDRNIPEDQHENGTKNAAHDVSHPADDKHPQIEDRICEGKIICGDIREKAG